MLERRCVYHLVTVVQELPIPQLFERKSESDWSNGKIKMRLLPTKYEIWMNDFRPYDHDIPYSLWAHSKRVNACLKTFNKKCSEQITKLFVFERYETTEKMFQTTQNIQEVFTEFLEWFDLKRRGFRQKMDADMVKASNGNIVKGKVPASHGGVANLLKTLTRTMEKQGASIESIAKVQYAVCIQAGIYIPDEFLEDVAVALDILK